MISWESDRKFLIETAKFVSIHLEPFKKMIFYY